MQPFLAASSDAPTWAGPRAVVGLYYFRNRYYDPEVGRFLQRDPVWDAGNVGGQYTFVGCGPRWAGWIPAGNLRQLLSLHHLPDGS
ncbi:MAG: RHS repeat-associated core domain-containing protein [Planctomycetota bacterium]